MEEFFSFIEPFWEDIDMLVIGTGIGFTIRDFVDSFNKIYLLRWSIIAIALFITLLMVGSKVWN